MCDPVETPSDLLRREEIELPDFIGLGGYHYRDCTLAYVVRVWQYLHESIDADSYETTGAFETNHRSELLSRADDLGVSTVQAQIAQSAAFHIQRKGFEKWRARQFEEFPQTFVWRPTDEFEWTDEKHAEEYAGMTQSEGSPLLDSDDPEREHLREVARNGDTEAERREARLLLVARDMKRHKDIYDALAEE